MKTHRSIRALLAAVLLSASLGLGAVPAQAAPISVTAPTNTGTSSGSSTVAPQGLQSMMCYWLPGFCR